MDEKWYIYETKRWLQKNSSVSFYYGWKKDSLKKCIIYMKDMILHCEKWLNDLVKKLFFFAL